MSEWWYEPSWGVNCGPNLLRLIAKGIAQIVLDVSDVLEVGSSNLSKNKEEEKQSFFHTALRNICKVYISFLHHVNSKEVVLDIVTCIELYIIVLTIS